MFSVRALVKTTTNIPDPQKQPIILVLQEPRWVSNNPASQAPLLLWARTHFPRQGRAVDCASDKDFYSVQHLSPWGREPGTFVSLAGRPTHWAWGCRVRQHKLVFKSSYLCREKREIRAQPISWADWRPELRDCRSIAHQFEFTVNATILPPCQHLDLSQICRLIINITCFGNHAH